MPIRRHPVAACARGARLRALPIDTALVGRLRGVFEQLSAHDLRLGEVFYSKLFSAAPHLKSLFHNTPTQQAEKLIQSLKLVVQNFEKPEMNAAMLADLGRRHASFGVKAEHYDLVIELMIESMGELLTPTVAPQLLDEWRIALRLISDQMIAAAVAGDADAATSRTPAK